MQSHLPYSKQGLERLAVALGVNSAQLWFEPNRGRIEMKSVPSHGERNVGVTETESDEHEEE